MEDQIIDGILHRQIRHAQNDASTARRDARESQTAIQELEEQVGRLTLVCTALWSLLKQRLNLSDTELVAIIEEVDLRDGRRDGKHRPGGHACTSCGRTNSVRHRFCIYCEEPLDVPPLP